MSALKYRLVTNWPASMSEDFAFEPTEDRNAHYDLCVEVLASIADEKDPSMFRVVEETSYDYEVTLPREPSLPRMPAPESIFDDDDEFAELCRRYTFAEHARLTRKSNATRTVRVSVTESFTLEGEQLAKMADLAKRDRANAKFRFILATYGVAEDEMVLVDDRSRTVSREGVATMSKSSMPATEAGGSAESEIDVLQEASPDEWDVKFSRDDLHDKKKDKKKKGDKKGKKSKKLKKLKNKIKDALNSKNAKKDKKDKKAKKGKSSKKDKKSKKGKKSKRDK